MLGYITGSTSFYLLINMTVHIRMQMRHAIYATHKLPYEKEHHGNVILFVVLYIT